METDKRLMMNYLIFLIIALCNFSHISAQLNEDNCQLSHIRVFPPTSEINSNSVIVLREIPKLVEIIPELNKKYPVYLKSGDTEIPLSVVEMYRANFIYAILKPETKLEAGKEYELIIDFPDEDLFCNRRERPCRVIYKATSVTETTPIFIKRKPLLMKNICTIRSCTRVYGAFFSICAKDTGFFLVKTVIKYSWRGPAYTDYILPDKQHQVFIGMGACSPLIYAKARRHVWVKFSVMDASGNVSVCNKKYIRFKLRKHLTHARVRREQKRAELINTKCKICQ